jgi:PAS domain S-box-containing protein
MTTTTTPDHAFASSAEVDADALWRLVGTSFRVADLKTVSELLIRIADQARAVLGAEEASVTVTFDGAALEAVASDGDDTVCGHVTDPSRARATRSAGLGEWVIQPIGEHHGAPRGTLALRIGRAIDERDRALLALLAQMAANALDTVDLLRSKQTSESRFRVLVEAAPVAIVEADLEGGAHWWNGAAADLLGWGPSGDAPIAQWHAPLGDMCDAWARARTGTKVVDHECIGIEMHDGRRDLSVSVAPLRSPSGTVRGFLTLLADVTDRRRLELELRRAHEAEAVGRLAGNVAHDFNNLLTLIAGYTSLLREQPSSGAAADQLLEGIEITTERATSLTDRLLAMSRAHAARPSSVLLEDAFASLADVLTRILGPGVELALDVDDAAESAAIDPAQFEQIILNLATNARDAMAGRGRLAIGARRAAADGGHHPLLGPGDPQYVEITVGDDGDGMSPDIADRCFEPYFSTKDARHGTGLGLATVKLAVTEAHGTVRVDSTPGEGTTFTVILPSGGRAPERIERGDNERVLVVEDDASMRALMVRTLERNGYSVVDAASGSAALTAVGDAPVDLLVTDIEMEGMDGFELAETVRSGTTTPVLFVSGARQMLDAPWSEGGAASLLTKPFTPSALLGAVQSSLGPRTSAR